MKRLAKLSSLVFLTGTLLTSSPAQKLNTGQAQCPVVEQALKDCEQVKTAGTRREVMKYFILDGGLQFPAKTRYVYPKCTYLHVEVEFELVRPAEIASLPDDKVIGVSKLYVEYPATD